MCLEKTVATCVNTVPVVFYSLTDQRLTAESDYLLKDAAGEAKFGVKLADALRRAKANQGKLFEGMTFYVTPKVPVEFKLLKNVVASGGGQVRVSPSPIHKSQHSTHS